MSTPIRVFITLLGGAVARPQVKCSPVEVLVTAATVPQSELIQRQLK
jgi:hypothetical protein